MGKIAKQAISKYVYKNKIYNKVVLTEFYLINWKGTLLLNEGIPRALKGKKLRLKNILLFPLIFEEINYF